MRLKAFDFMEYITDITGIGVAVVSVILFYKLARNQIKSNTCALKELTGMIRDLKVVIHAKK